MRGQGDRAPVGLDVWSVHRVISMGQCQVVASCASCITSPGASN